MCLPCLTTASTLIKRVWLLATLFALAGCGGITPIWKGSCASVKETKTLYYQQPCEYLIPAAAIPTAQDYALELTVTYYSQIGRAELPLFIAIWDEQGETREFSVTIPLKENGKYRGEPAGNELDLTLSHLAIPAVSLQPQDYQLSVYFSGTVVMETEVDGIIGLDARLYRARDYLQE